MLYVRLVGSVEEAVDTVAGVVEIDAARLRGTLYDVQEAVREGVREALRGEDVLGCTLSIGYLVPYFNMYFSALPRVFHVTGADGGQQTKRSNKLTNSKGHVLVI